MKKIVHVCLTGIVTEGFSYQDNLLPKYHKKAGYEVTVICSTYVFNEKGKVVKTDGALEYINENGVKIIRIENKRNTTYMSRFKKYCDFVSILEKENPDILFVHGVQFLDIAPIVKYLKRHRDVTVYADNHADFNNSAKNWLSKQILHKVIWRHYAKKIEPYVTKFYGTLPCRVDFMKEVYKLEPKKCELLVMGVDDDVLDSIDCESLRIEKSVDYGISEEDFVIVTGGKIDGNKTQTLDLMDAVNSIDEFAVKLVIFGSVSDELKDKFNEKLSDRICYVSWKSSNDIYKEFAIADLIVFPGLHSVLWEQAVGMGKPCLFKRIQGIDHIDVNGNCKFIEVDGVEDLRRAIIDCKNNIAAMKEAAEQNIGKQFSYKNISIKSIGGQ